jgi:hypothetical protein
MARRGVRFPRPGLAARTRATTVQREWEEADLIAE